jgi:hypothetical protein
MDRKKEKREKRIKSKDHMIKKTALIGPKIGQSLCTNYSNGVEILSFLLEIALQA